MLRRSFCRHISQRTNPGTETWNKNHINLQPQAQENSVKSYWTFPKRNQPWTITTGGHLPWLSSRASPWLPTDFHSRTSKVNCFTKSWHRKFESSRLCTELLDMTGILCHPEMFAKHCNMEKHLEKYGKTMKTNPKSNWSERSCLGTFVTRSSPDVHWWRTWLCAAWFASNPWRRSWRDLRSWRFQTFWST